MIEYGVWLRRIGYIMGLATLWWLYFTLIELFQPLPYPSLGWTATRFTLFPAFFVLLWASLKAFRYMRVMKP